LDRLAERRFVFGQYQAVVDGEFNRMLDIPVQPWPGLHRQQVAIDPEMVKAFTARPFG
jgi:hypothetical protein